MLRKSDSKKHETEHEEEAPAAKAAGMLESQDRKALRDLAGAVEAWLGAHPQALDVEKPLRDALKGAKDQLGH